MRQLLERAGNRAAPESRAAFEDLTPEAGLTSQRQMRSALAFLALFGLIFGGIGAVNMVREQRRLTTWLPVEATVLSKRVDEHSDSDGSTSAEAFLRRSRSLVAMIFAGIGALIIVAVFVAARRTSRHRSV
ncbi:MAG: hypothetical protein ACT4P6_22030 [Gemmatimonadaceae bacterium]